MKQLIFLLVCACNLLSTPVIAQIDFSIKTGVSFSTLAVEDYDTNPHNSSVVGIPIGISADIKLYKYLFLQPSVYLSRKGFNSESFGFGEDFTAKVSYLEMPIHFLAKHKFGKNSLVLGAGPYFAYGLGGSWKTDKDVAIGDIIIGKEGKINFHKDASHNNYGDYVYGKPWDYGVSFLVGFELLGKYLVQLNSAIGIENITSSWGNYQPDYKTKNRTLSLTLGYLF